jgi:large subunit ribosomal protein L23
MSKSLQIKPRLSEKTYTLSESRVYVVDVPSDANKFTIAAAVEAQFEVKVDHVRVANIKGKRKRTMSITGKRMSNANGKRSNVKKAYVTLKEGNSLPFFAAIEEEEAAEQETQAKIDKEMEKQAKKDDKPKRGLRKKPSPKDADEEKK